MEVPDWLKPLIQQFPIASLALGMTMLGVWWLNRLHKEERKRLDQIHADSLARADAEIDRMKKASDILEKRHLAEIDRLKLMNDAVLKELHGQIEDLRAHFGGKRS